MVEKISRSRDYNWRHHPSFNPNREIGKARQRRALFIIQTLVEEGVYSMVTNASGKQVRDGIDLWLYPQGVDYRIPVQVAGSYDVMQKFIKSRRKPEEIMVLVINEHKDDERIRVELNKAVARWNSNNSPQMVQQQA